VDAPPPMQPARLTTLRDAMTMQPPGGPPSWRLVRSPLRLALWAALRSGLRVAVEGERVDGPAVIVSNHPHVIDGLVVLLTDPTMRPVARWHEIALLRAGMWVADCLVTTTGTPVRPHRGAYAAALAHLRTGGRVWIAPEGGVQRELALRYPRTGAVRLAHAAGAPLQVLAVVHEQHPGPDIAVWRTRRRARITLRWGPVVSTTGDVAADIDRMMEALAATAGATWDRRAPSSSGDPPGTGGDIVADPA
jgi:1-acyl-sn-glycerol-3-phosphate acyltransferase